MKVGGEVWKRHADQLLAYRGQQGDTHRMVSRKVVACSWTQLQTAGAEITLAGAEDMGVTWPQACGTVSDSGGLGGV